jgi:transcriptional regulator with XRE-family HTH domain
MQPQDPTQIRADLLRRTVLGLTDEECSDALPWLRRWLAARLYDALRRDPGFARLTETEIEDRIGLSRTTLWRWRTNGKRVRFDSLEKLEAKLGAEWPSGRDTPFGTARGRGNWYAERKRRT